MYVPYSYKRHFYRWSWRRYRGRRVNSRFYRWTANRFNMRLWKAYLKKKQWARKYYGSRQRVRRIARRWRARAAARARNNVHDYWLTRYRENLNNPNRARIGFGFGHAPTGVNPRQLNEALVFAAANYAEIMESLRAAGAD